MSSEFIIATNMVEEDALEISDIDSSTCSAIQCLENPLILQQIFRHLSLHHLLSLSLVNKTWLKETRLVLLKRHCCLRIDGTSDIAKQFQDANEIFRASSVQVPCNGLNISICPYGQAFQAKKETEIVEQVDLSIPGIFPLKYLHITEASDGVWDASFESSDFIYSACVHLVLKNSDTLEELHIGGKLFRFFEIFQEIVKNQKFTMPQLKVLCPFEVCWEKFEDLSEAVGALGKLISFAPNLSEIGGEWNTVGLRALAPEMRRLVRRLGIDGEEIFSEELMSCKSSIYSIRANNIYRLPYPHHIPQDLASEQGWFITSIETQRFMQNLRLALTLNLDSLRQLELPYCTLKSLAEDGQNPMESVVHLKLWAHGNFLRSNPAKYCAQLLPRLKHIEFENEALDCWRYNLGKCSCSLTDDQQGTQQQEEFICAHLESVAMAEIPMFNEAFVRFTRAIPNVVCFQLKIRNLSCRSVFAFLPHVWESMRSLKKIQISFEGWYSRENLDAVFCGISSEEAATLSKQDSRILEALQIVPSSPSILNLKSLRELGLIIKEDAPDWRSSQINSWFLSNVTIFLAFSRMRDLKVNLMYSPEHFKDVSVLRHVQPFVHVTALDRSSTA